MGWLDKLAGRPTEGREAVKRSGSVKREERAAERAALRASRESALTTSSVGGQYGRSHSRRQSGFSSPPSPRGPSPLPSPRSVRLAQDDQYRDGRPSPHGPQQQQVQPGAVQRQPGLTMQPGLSRDSMLSDRGAHMAANPAYAQAQKQQVRDLQQKVSIMDAQLQEVESLKQRLLAEQRAANDWKERWNYQNFKLNLMVDMMVLSALELDQGGLESGGGHVQ